MFSTLKTCLSGWSESSALKDKRFVTVPSDHCSTAILAFLSTRQFSYQFLLGFSLVFVRLDGGDQGLPAFFNDSM